MNFNVNEKKQAQCPACGQWANMKYNEQCKQYEIEHCRKKYAIFLTEAGYNAMFNEDKKKE